MERDALLVDGASRLRAMIPVVLIGRDGSLTAFLAAFGRAIGGSRCNCHRWRQYPRLHPHDDDCDRVETSKGELSFALTLGIILIILSMTVSG
jgi:tungstate transport system permease protein